MAKNEEKNQSVEQAGASLGAAEAAGVYADNVVFQAARGHGFAAEKANHWWDIFTGKVARLVGGDNAKNGADRIVNDVLIQTKYCASGGKCIAECFGEQGEFRYLTPDGRPMQIEVPADMYESAVQSMQERIRQGKIPGVSDPKKAAEIVRKGNVTYAQARNIAKLGTVEGLTYDATNGIRLAGGAASVSAAVAFAMSIWRGEDGDAALEAACQSGLQVGGVVFITTIVSSQIGRTGVELSLRPASDWVIGQLGPKASSWIASSLREAQGLSSLSGAAATNHLSKLLRGNAVTGSITTIVLSSGDFVRLFQGRISFGQAFKNISTTGASVAGGIGGASVGSAAGATAGAAIGSAIPVLGTAVGALVGKFVGGFLGGLVGGSAAGSATSTVLGGMIEDDANEMLAIVNEVFGELAVDYLLSEEEAKAAINSFEELDLIERLRDMYASSDRREFAGELLTPLIENQVKRRPKVLLPTGKQLLAGIRSMVESAQAAEALERREKLFQKIGSTFRWSALVGVVASLIWLGVDYWNSLPGTAQNPVVSGVQKSNPPEATEQAPISQASAPASAPVENPVVPSVEPQASSERMAEAIKNRNYGEARRLLRVGNDAALSTAYQGVTSFLLDSGANFYGNADAFGLLKDLIGRDAALIDMNSSGRPVWQGVLYAVQNNNEKFLEILELLLTHGIDVNQLDERGKPILDSGLVSYPLLRDELAKRGACTMTKNPDLQQCGH